VLTVHHPKDGAPVSERTRAARSPAVVHAVVVVVIAAIVATVALDARQPPPPTVAEFAPRAVERITAAPAEQAPTGAGPAGATTSTTIAGAGARPTVTTRPAVDLPRVRRCVGDPPRQTEDPQSPPCVAYFSGDNGGATAKGVTGDKITVIYPFQQLETESFVQKLVDYFNRRFELYGRKIVLARIDVAGFAQPDPAEMQQAARAKSKIAFASLTYPDRKGGEHYYYDELAREKVVSVVHRALAQGTEAHLRSFAPFEWSVFPGSDTMLRDLGESACATLVGRVARYAGPGSQRDRVFGVVKQVTADHASPDVTPLVDTLHACGAGEVTVVDDQESASTRTGLDTIVRLNDAGVTTAICVCDSGEVRSDLMPAASAQAYQPEWVLTTYVDADLDNSLNGAPPEQAAHVLGLSFRNKLLARQNMPWYWAIKEIDPSAEPSANDYYSLSARYASLLLLASGIQMAGPRLTPERFEAALHATRFPNPGAGGPPYYQARVGFDGGRHSMTADGVLFWFDPSRAGTVDGTSTGRVCYLYGGRRFAHGQWVRNDPPYQTECS
jgi:hypothetical protein